VRRDLRRWLREIHDQTGHTTVFVTHDQEEALELADRVVVMSQGKIEQVGTPDNIYDEPNAPFVFSFIGESSELPVRVEEGKVLFDGSPLNFSAGDCPNGPARMFFRPQDVEVGSEGTGAIQGVISTMRRHGGARRLDVEVGREGHRIEIELPSKFEGSVKGRIAVLPRRWRLYPERPANA
jgi:sulfate transport system ATP-binding protein